MQRATKNAAAGVPKDAMQPTTLYVQTAAKATVEHRPDGSYKITMSGASPSTTWVTDRPERQAGVLPNGGRAEWGLQGHITTPGTTTPGALTHAEACTHACTRAYVHAPAHARTHTHTHTHTQ